MKIDLESDDLKWRFYVSLTWEAFYFVIVLASVDFEFHIHNLRSIDKEFE